MRNSLFSIYWLWLAEVGLLVSYLHNYVLYLFQSVWIMGYLLIGFLFLLIRFTLLFTLARLEWKHKIKFLYWLRVSFIVVRWDLVFSLIISKFNISFFCWVQRREAKEEEMYWICGLLSLFSLPQRQEIKQMNLFDGFDLWMKWMNQINQINEWRCLIYLLLWVMPAEPSSARSNSFHQIFQFDSIHTACPASPLHLASQINQSTNHSIQFHQLR